MVKWDKGIDYESFYTLLMRDIPKLKGRSRCYAFILLIQLRNGLRISEAVRAFLKYVRSGSREIKVEVSKKRKREERLVVIPEPPFDVKECVELSLLSERKLRDLVRNFCYRRYGVNTHSLRYAFISYLLKQGVNPAIVSKITKHSRLDYILTYTQEKEAEKTLKDPSLF